MQYFSSYRTVLGVFTLVSIVGSIPDKAGDDPVKTASLCTVCKYLAAELQETLDATAKSKEILRTGQVLDNAKVKKINYHTSELRLTEALHEPHICEKILKYKVHAEREGSLRYAKGESQTMEALHGLVHKGVKVELGMPYEMWDKPSAEVTTMQRKCYQIVEEYEEDIEDWFYNHQHEHLDEFLCRHRVLGKKNYECLSEVFVSEEDASKNKKEKKSKGSKLKGDAEGRKEL